MTKNKIKVTELPEFDMAQHLSDTQAVAQYLTIVLEENDIDSLKQALQTVARAQGMKKTANQSNITREGLYKALRPAAKPQFSTIASAIQGLGLKLVVEPTQ